MTQKCLVCDKACDESSGWKNAKEQWVHRKCFDMEIAKTPPGESVFHCYRDPARRRSLERLDYIYRLWDLLYSGGSAERMKKTGNGTAVSIADTEF